MRVALVTTFPASRKEPLATMLERVHQGFVAAGLTEPIIRFNFGDGMIPGGVSSVDRVLKRHPELERFVTSADPMPNMRGARRISNGPLSAGAGESVPYSTLQEIAAGVPRSFPFHGVAFHLFTPEFGDQVQGQNLAAGILPGVLVSDSWWVNGRNRSLSACVILEADPDQKKLPAPPASVATILTACGKPRKTMQVPLADKVEAGPTPAVRAPTGMLMPSTDPEKTKAVHEVVLRFRQQLPEIVNRARLPHDLPDNAEAHKLFALEVTSGPKKPALESVFKPLGYSCKGEAGDFTLRRHTAANYNVQVSIGIGSWGHSVTAHYHVWGLGFRALLSLPPTARGTAMGQYPVGDAEYWRKIVENLGALVAELDRSFVPEIEAVAGPSPAWYSPEK